MDNYTKGTVVEVESSVGIKCDDDAVHMKVAAGSKIRNLMTYAMKQMKGPSVKQITWNGSGAGTSKVITCAEIMKRKVKGLHQITEIRFNRTKEYWEPKLEGLERLKVNRDVPAITILLSKEPLDPTLPGYQPPGPFDAFWKKRSLAAITPKDRTGRRPHRGLSSADVRKGRADSSLYDSLRKKKKKHGAPVSKDEKSNDQNLLDNSQQQKQAKENKNSAKQTASTTDVPMDMSS